MLRRLRPLFTAVLVAGAFLLPAAGADAQYAGHDGRPYYGHHHRGHAQWSFGVGGGYRGMYGPWYGPRYHRHAYRGPSYRYSDRYEHRYVNPYPAGGYDGSHGHAGSWNHRSHHCDDRYNHDGHHDHHDHN